MSGKKRKPQQWTQAQYVKHQGVRCPFCRAECYTYTVPKTNDGGEITQAVYCTQCKRGWDDVYHLVGYRSTTLQKESNDGQEER